MANINKIRLSGQTYNIQDQNAQPLLTAGQGITIENNVISATGGGSITVDTALDSGSTNPVENRVIYSKIDEVEEVTAAGLNALNDKINPTVELTQAQYNALVSGGTVDPNTYYIITDAEAGDLTQYWTSAQTNSAITAAVSGKQDTLVSGTNIKTINNESILGSGNIDIQGGGVDVVQTTGTSTTDVMSQNAVTTQLNNKANKSAAVGGYRFGSTNNVNYLQYRNVNNDDKDNSIYYPKINGKGILTSNSTFAQNNYDFQLVETSAITTSVSSSSTDTQIPSAKAVYDAIQEGGGGTVDQTIISGSTNAVAGGAVYNKIDEVEQVTAAGLNALNDELGGIQDSLSGYATTDTEQIISGRKIFTYSNTNAKAIEFKQTDDTTKLGFRVRTSAATNNELAAFEFRPDTYTDSSSVKHPLLYLGHYRNNSTANAGVAQTMFGFRQYDQSGGAAYHYLMPLPAEAKTPFSLTTSYKNYFAPLGFKNGSTMITADNTGVVDLSSELGGLKLMKISQTDYDNLQVKDQNTLYIIVN